MAREGAGQGHTQGNQAAPMSKTTNGKGDEQDAPQTLAQILNGLLVEHGWSQRELAAQLGVDPSRISRVLSSREGMSMRRVPRIAELTGLPEHEVAAAVWNASRTPGQRPATLGERVSQLENTVDDLREQVAKIASHLEAALTGAGNSAGSKPPAKRTPGKRAPRHRRG